MARTRKPVHSAGTREAEQESLGWIDRIQIVLCRAFDFSLDTENQRAHTRST